MKLVIGYGPTSAGDRGVGYIIAEKLLAEAAITSLRSRCEIIARQQLSPDLADEVAAADEVIFMDACPKTSPGQVRLTEIKATGADWKACIQQMTPAALLECVKQVYGRTPKARQITIGSETSTGEHLSKPVESAMYQVISEVRRM